MTIRHFNFSNRMIIWENLRIVGIGGEVDRCVFYLESVEDERRVVVRTD